MSRLATTALLALAVLAGPARAQPGNVPRLFPAVGTDRSVHRHLDGYFHADVGMGYLDTSASLLGVGLSAHAPSADASLSLGVTVVENFVLAARLWTSTARNVDARVGGIADKLDELTLSGLGLDVTHYLSPPNLFITVTPSLTRLTLRGLVDETTRTGLGLRAAMGWEQWVGAHWGLGFDAHLAYSVNEEKGQVPLPLHSLQVGFAVTATYN